MGLSLLILCRLENAFTQMILMKNKKPDCPSLRSKATSNPVSSIRLRQPGYPPILRTRSFPSPDCSGSGFIGLRFFNFLPMKEQEECRRETFFAI
jgi:hypothetical protein